MRAPPIQEPWTTDKLGRLKSPAWVLWLQDLSNSNAIDNEVDMFLNSQPVSVQVDNSYVDQQIFLASPKSSSNEINDLITLIWLNL